ncbi:uncharacterized protein EI97DRAFT_105100 [Westerdykella ornata]|uniref:Uncharacterized protein n=1 Tax=Westerdykella ornata TaxID=318751 RepID=A0A6A6JTG0_WESOR|nr:uncharacterized protein EI97DRAFT_105100 [Westerdykella ornata]KAF2279901.1 hypothetical protein EI97DRAFT_105100 [Westerdykella ornata]
MSSAAVSSPLQANGSQKSQSLSGSEDSLLSPSLDAFAALSSPKIRTTREILLKSQSLVRPSFWRSTSVAFEGQNSVHDFLNILKNERLRHMPHDGSYWDRILRWADNIGGIVLLSHDVLKDFMLNSEDATRLICDSCTALIRLGNKHVNVLLKAFSVFHKMAFALSTFLRQTHIIQSTPDARRELAHAFQKWARFTSDVKEYLTLACRGVPIKIAGFVDLDTVISLGTASFYSHLESVSISMWGSSHYNLHEIREFLSPQDSVVKAIMSNQLYSESKRAEYTCDWFGPRLRKFSKDTSGKNILLITGGACTGKTVLSRWIQEQEFVEDELVAYAVDTNVKYTTSPLSLIKSLVLQLLDRRIGREGLLARIAKAMEHAQNGCPSSEVEATLWSALEASLDNRKLLILIDGLDQLAGSRIGNPQILETLHRITKSRRNVKAIILSRPVSEAARKHCQEFLVLEDLQESSNDIRNYVEDFIQHNANLRNLTESEKSEIVRQFAESSHRSFLWAELQLQAIEHENSAAAILKACQTAPKTVDEYIDHLTATRLDAKRMETKNILSWVLAAERPLTLKEIKALLEVNPDECAFRPYSGDVEALIRQLCGSIVVIQDNLAYLRHPSIRERLLATTSAGSKGLVIDLKEAHKSLATRSLTYCKINLLPHDDLDPQVEFYDTKEMAESFGRHALFEYAARYWILHFRSSSLYDKSTKKFNLSAQFKICFAATVRLALYEGSCLGRQYIAVEAETLQDLAFSIRRTLLGERSAAVLQSLLMELRIGKGFKDAHVLSEYSYEAFKVSRHVCAESVVLALAEFFIKYSASLEISKHKEFREKKIEVLNYLIEVYERGQIESKQITYLGYLAELYVDIKDIRQAVVIYRKLYRLRLHAYGHLHSETHALFQLLITYLKQLSYYDEVLSLTLEYHEYLEETLAITDHRRIESTLHIISIYEERKELFQAEQVLVRFWKSVSSAQVTARIVELKVEFALRYTEFLHRYERKEECEVVLRGLWTEIQSYSYEYRYESKMIKRVQEIAEYFSKLEIFSMSRSIYQSIYEYYESREERTSVECITIVRYLAETITKSFSYSKETSSSSTTTTSSTTVISKEEKKTLTEIFESSLESTEVTSTAIAICQALCSSYVHEERYEEACEIYMRVISKVWASIGIITSSTDITILSERLTVEIVELCIGLAECHFKMLHLEIVEAIYLNIFRALICVRHIENKQYILERIRTIIAFFELTYKYERVIEIYRELFIWMPICFGKTHRETIRILIEFARICFRLRLYDEASTACFYVYSCFHTAEGCLRIDGFDAAILLAEIYEIQGKWHLAYEVYRYLWRTFIHFGAEYKIEATVIQKIYERYIFILEHKELVDISLLIEISKEYHHHCLSLYKHHHEVTIRAALAYAQFCEHKEEHRELAISLYQEVLKYCKTTETEFSRKIVHICNTRVARLYSFSTKEISKAVEIYHEEFEMSKKISRTSTETLTALHSYVSTCKKQSTTESITRATHTLKTSALEIFHQESSSETLITSARSIAKTYKECSFTEQAQSLIVEMRSKLVEEVRATATTTTESHYNSYIFLASFQEAISESTSFTTVMSEIREEILLYQSYFKATSTKTDYRSIIKAGRGLYFHLQHKSEYHAEFINIKKELVEYFYRYLDFKRTVNQSVIDVFFQLYIEEVTKTRYEHEVIKRALDKVHAYTKSAKFVEAYDLALLMDRFIHLHGGFESESYIRIGFTLAKYLVGVGTNKCGDQKLYAAMLDFSRIVLQESLKGLDRVDIELDELQQLLADLISTLSVAKKYEDLERILQALWESRKVRNNLASSPLVLYIGRSLIQTLACLNKFSDAIHLCYHIRYNLAYIRGTLDKSTLEFTVLLSELYTQQKRYQDAIELHEDILYRLSDGQSAPGLDAISIATTHTELLKMAYRRQGGDQAPQQYAELFATLDRRFADKQMWKEKRPQLDKWAGQPVKEGETFGSWKRPAKFEWRFEEEETVAEKGWREELSKRRVSGKIWGSSSRAEEEQRRGVYVMNGNGSVYGKEGAVEQKEAVEVD